MDKLRAAGCERILQEHGSVRVTCPAGSDETARRTRHGDMLVVVCLDRLARSVNHLLQVIEDLEERGVHFRSIRHRHVDATWSVFASSPRSRRTARTRADRGANLSRHQSSKGWWEVTRQSWSSRTMSGSNQGGLKGSGETLSRRADLVCPDPAANRAATSPETQLGQCRAGP